jgi:hypothetical protein
MEKVIPKQKTFYKIKIDNSEEFYINLGKYLPEELYYLKKVDLMCRKTAILIIDKLEIACKYGDYILIDTEDNKNIRYVDETSIEDYIEIKGE